jgi:hypothetical protein
MRHLQNTAGSKVVLCDRRVAQETETMALKGLLSDRVDVTKARAKNRG